MAVKPVECTPLVGGLAQASASAKLVSELDRLSALPVSGEDIRADETGGDRRRGWFYQAFNVTSYYLPILVWLPSYRLAYLSHDVLAGMTVGLLLIPNGLAYASLAQVAPVHGLYTCIFPPLVYAVLGSSRQLSIGPGAMSAILTGHFSGAIASSLGVPPNPSIVFSLSLMVGLMLLFLGVFRLGFLESVLSKPVMAGFVIAVAFAIGASQLFTAFGIPPCHDCPDNATSQILYWAGNVHTTHLPTLAVAVASFLTLHVAQVAKRKLQRFRYARFLSPVPLVVVAATLASAALDLSGRFGVHVMGVINSEFRPPQVPQVSLELVEACMVPASVIATILILESLVVGKTYAAKYNYALSPNRELIAFGMANLISSLFFCIPCAGSFVRSKVCDMSGGRTQLAGLLAGLVSLAVVAWLLPLLQFLPKCTIAAIVLLSALHLLEQPVHQLGFLVRLRAWKDVCLLAAMLISTAVFGARNSIFLAFAACLFMLIKRTNQPAISLLGTLVVDKGDCAGPMAHLPRPGELESAREGRSQRPSSESVASATGASGAQGRVSRRYRVVDMRTCNRLCRPLPGVLALSLRGPLHFANATRLRELLWRVESFGDLRSSFKIRLNESQVGRSAWVLLDLLNVPSMDASAVETLFEVAVDYVDRGMRVLLVRRPGDLEPLVTLVGLGQRLSKQGGVFDSLDDALDFLCVHADPELVRSLGPIATDV